jgi:hypothetical protein
MRGPQDIAFLDLRLGGVSGLDLLPRLLAERPGLEVRHQVDQARERLWHLRELNEPRDRLSEFAPETPLEPTDV